MHLLTDTVLYPGPMHPLDPALQALTLLREGAAHHATAAQATLRLARLEAAIRQAQAVPNAPEQLFRQALSLRGAHPTAADPAWRTVICSLAGYAFTQGVPAPSLVRALRADQFASDLRHEPRLHGEPLVQQQGRELRLHPDIAQVRPGTQSLN